MPSGRPTGPRASEAPGGCSERSVGSGGRTDGRRQRSISARIGGSIGSFSWVRQSRAPRQLPAVLKPTGGGQFWEQLPTQSGLTAAVKLRRWAVFE